MKLFQVAFVILFGLLTSASAQLLISEYVDANTTRGAIELWNISGTNVTFGTGSGQSDVRVEIYANGSASPTATIILTSGFALGAGNVFVLGHSSAPFAPICDQVSGAVSWTGNDAIVVRLGSGTIIDSLGQVGVDPGIEWGTGSASTADNTLRRIVGNMIADTNPGNPYDPALYFEGYPLNNTDDLGLPPLANSLASVGTYAPANVSTNSATLYGEINSHNTSATMWFDHGTSTNYSASTPAQVAGSGTHGYQHVLTGLVSGVSYHYRAAASNSLGVVFGTNVSFTTPILAFSLVTNLTALHSGISGWGDYDNDGRLDLVLCGIWQTYTESISTFYRYKMEFWRNEGIGFSRFELDNPVPAASITWGDADHDGWLDALIHTVHIVFIGDGNVMRSSLSVMPTPADPSPTYFGISVGNILYMVPSWGDFNNDGKLDAASGVLYRNTGQALVTNGLSGANFGPSAWADFDNDGRLDLALQYHSNVVWRNAATGFTEINAGLPNLQEVSFVPGDYDNDGRIDLLMTGRDGLEPVAQVWRNTGSGFTNINAGLTGFFRGAAAWGDYDNDGRLDLLLTGQTNSFGLPAATELWRNTQSGFSKVDLAPRLPPLVNSHVAWADFDNDGRLDIFIQGSTNRSDTGAVAQIWRNNTSQSNTPPSAPSGLSASIVNNEIVFTWNSASDSQTPAPGLTYNMRAGTTPGGIDLVSPLAASGGFRRLPATGNRGHARIWTMPLTNLPLGTPVYWSVQSIDSAFAGSSFSQEHSFRLLHATPPPPNPPLLLPVTTTNLFYGDLNGDGVVDQEELNSALAPYVQHSPFLQMTNVMGLGQSNISFTLSNSTAGAFSVESSTNLFDWNFLGPALPRYEFVDTNAPAGPQRYYRLRWP